MAPGKPLKHALGLYFDGIRDGNIDRALSENLGNRYVQHSTGVADGPEGFRLFFSDFLKRCPDRKLTLLRTIEDGPNCFVHVLQEISTLSGESACWITMDLFDTDTDGKVVEHWDVITASKPTEQTVSGNSMTHGILSTPIDKHDDDVDKTQVNKIIVKDFAKQVLTLGKTNCVDRFVDETFVQHAAHLADGRDALRKAVESGQAGKMEMLFKVIGQRNLVVTLSKMITVDTTSSDDGGADHNVQSAKHIEHCAFDVYRLENDRIVEQWSAWESIMPRSEWANSGKF